MMSFGLRKAGSKALICVEENVLVRDAIWSGKDLWLKKQHCDTADDFHDETRMYSLLKGLKK